MNLTDIECVLYVSLVLDQHTHLIEVERQIESLEAILPNILLQIDMGTLSVHWISQPCGDSTYFIYKMKLIHNL